MQIKTGDLCERCEHSYVKWCIGKHEKDCTKCDHQTIEKDRCLCLTVKVNTPCPYFKEVDDG